MLTNGNLLVMPNGLMARTMNIKDGYAIQLALVEVQLGGLSRGFIGGGRIGGSVRLVVLRRLSAACIGFVVVLGCGMGGGSIDVGFVEWFVVSIGFVVWMLFYYAACGVLWRL